MMTLPLLGTGTETIPSMASMRMMGLDTSLKNALAMDDTKFSTTGGSSKTFYVDENTQYLGVDDYADDIDTVYAMGGMRPAPLVMSS